MYYVAWSCEHLRDGHEERTKIYNNKKDAINWLNSIRDGWGGDGHEFKLFELGKQIPLEEEVIQQQEVVKKEIKRYKI